MCGKYVRCCLFHHDGIQASSAIDFSSISGIGKLVMLLVHLSFCSAERLGYDTTMRRSKDGSRWEIACADHSDSSNSNEPTWCTTTSAILNASSVFGRHTRCYAARYEADERIEEGIVKDSWFLPRDKQKSDASAAYVPNEAHNLRLITETLGKEKQSFLYPKA
ncbi:hypothetical protein EV175_005211, partial [Coemansia sp. RSA 1933]